jgi:SAM-dependent methyltransferase
MDYDRYVALRSRITPQLRFNQSIYEDAVLERVVDTTVWLDAGCGRRVLPDWRQAAECTLVARARLAVGCDLDHGSIRTHRTLRRLVVADLAKLPFKNGCMNLVTSNMVAEHLDQPPAVFREFARILRGGGCVIVHTPNAWSYVVMLSRVLPRRLKLRLVRILEGRTEEDVFPTRYRANTRRRLRALMSKAGLLEDRCQLLASEAVLARTHPLLVIPELLYIRLSLAPAFKFLRSTILATFVKPHPRRSPEVD